MCGTAPNTGNLADVFKVSQSQLSRLITAKKFKSGPSGYVPKWQKTAVESKMSGGASKKAEDQDLEEDELERYLVQLTKVCPVKDHISVSFMLLLFKSCNVLFLQIC